MGNLVAIVGRPNVGKSTLFNRLVKKREAIVDVLSGVTRDRHYGKTDWNGKAFSIIDTGGYLSSSDDHFQKEIDKQVQLAIDEADVIIFLTDLRVGVMPDDEAVLRLLRVSKKPFLLVANKADTPDKELLASEFYSMGIDAVYPISAANGSGTGDLLDEVVSYFPESEPEEEDIPKIAIVGRPNVGKSSLVNALLEENRAIVSEVSGTTRDTTSSIYNKYGHLFKILDTAGIRKKKKVKEDIEFYSVMRSIRTIEEADVCVLMIDAVQGIEGQDERIFWLAAHNKKGIVVLVNKWDLVEDKETQTHITYTQYIKKALEPFQDVPIVYVSVKNKQRVLKALDSVMDVYNRRCQRISTSILNDDFLPILKKMPPPMTRGREINIKFCMQLPSPRPQFVFYCNYPEQIKEPYKRFVENKLRANYNLTGIPIDVFFRKK